MNAVNPEEVGKSIKAYYGGSQADFNNLPDSVLIRVTTQYFVLIIINQQKLSGIQ